ncbi:acyltransferase [Endozoicomonas numazuensis]|uniref:acyltransferase n=1 Tax=Endozoicomonas numazuensis TaxID=1137799 RepID=UPI000689DAC1|nr:acyltransferase [Endozoicomonas numazuensis]
MIGTFKEYFTGLLSLSILMINTLLLSLPLLCFSLLKLIIPLKGFRRLMGRMANAVAELWISINAIWIKGLLGINLNITGLSGLNPNGYYLVTANHQSWADILLMQHLLNKKIPFMKFFLKQELIYVPVIGLCWWALDFPFMKRYTKAYLEKHPEKRGKDLESTLKACEKFKTMPVSIVNYLEGTRFTESKHSKQQSPFKHLLKPRAGGISYVIGALGEQVRTLLNITIVYHKKGQMGFWDFLCGRISNVSIHIEQQTIPESFIGRSYQQDAEFRNDFQAWVNKLWEDKDQVIHQLSHRQKRVVTSPTAESASKSQNEVV